MEKIKESINKHFDDMETIKDHYGYFYHMTEIVTITILGTFCGLKSLKQIHQWSIDERTRIFLREHFKITEIPSYSWLTQMLGLIKPESFNERFISWAFELVGGENNESTISFDGKTVRSTAKMKKYAKPLHIVSGHLGELGITLGQKAVQSKSNEIPAVRDLIEQLNIEGCLVVADALNCQKETAKVIIENGGDYLLSVKDNHSDLKEDITDYVEDEQLRSTMEQAKQIEKSRDRVERRVAYVTTDIDWLYDKDKWVNLACIGAINTKVETSTGETNEWHYFISNRPLSAEELLKHARLEWSVETMHWLLDVHFSEDFSRVAEQRTHENLNMIRKIVLNCIRTYKNEKSDKSPFSGLMFDCLLNPKNILKFL